MSTLSTPTLQSGWPQLAAVPTSIPRTEYSPSTLPRGHESTDATAPHGSHARTSEEHAPHRCCIHSHCLFLIAQECTSWAGGPQVDCSNDEAGKHPAFRPRTTCTTQRQQRGVGSKSPPASGQSPSRRGTRWCASVLPPRPPPRAPHLPRQRVHARRDAARSGRGRDLAGVWDDVSPDALSQWVGRSSLCPARDACRHGDRTVPRLEEYRTCKRGQASEGGREGAKSWSASGGGAEAASVAFLGLQAVSVDLTSVPGPWRDGMPPPHLGPIGMLASRRRA